MTLNDANWFEYNQTERQKLKQILRNIALI
jgi:hypothetical protein